MVQLLINNCDPFVFHFLSRFVDALNRAQVVAEVDEVFQYHTIGRMPYKQYILSIMEHLYRQRLQEVVQIPRQLQFDLQPLLIDSPITQADSDTEIIDLTEETKSDQEEYEVVEILDDQTDDQGDWFLVRFEGYPDPEWIPADNMYPHAMELVHEYFKNKV
jgi:hypothetical protein